MAWFNVAIISRTIGPSWRTLGIPDGSPVTDKFLIQAVDAVTAERLALGEAEQMKGRRECTVKEATARDVSESIVHLDTAV